MGLTFQKDDNEKDLPCKTKKHLFNIGHTDNQIGETTRKTNPSTASIEITLKSNHFFAFCAFFKTLRRFIAFIAFIAFIVFISFMSHTVFSRRLIFLSFKPSTVCSRNSTFIFKTRTSSWRSPIFLFASWNFSEMTDEARSAPYMHKKQLRDRAKCLNMSENLPTWSPKDANIRKTNGVCFSCIFLYFHVFQLCFQAAG